MASVMTSLDAVVREYFRDTEFQQKRQQIIVERDKRVPTYKKLIEQFNRSEITLKLFSAMLYEELQNDDCWGESRWQFLQQINNFAEIHAKNISDSEGVLRTILTGLNVFTVGQRIEQLYQKIEMDRKWLLALPKAERKKTVSPKSVAFIISHFALWLDRDHKPYIYDPLANRGIMLLLSKKLILTPHDIHRSRGEIEIISDADHNVVATLLDGLAAAAPKLKTDAYWADLFLTWTMEQTSYSEEDPSQTQMTPVRVESDVVNNGPPIIDLGPSHNSRTTSLPILRVPDSTSTTSSRSEDGPLPVYGVKPRSSREYKNVSTTATTIGTDVVTPEASNGNEKADVLYMEELIVEKKPVDLFYIEDQPLKPTPEPLLTQLIAELRRHILIDESIVRDIYHALLGGHLILTGPPGTGKTELARLIPEILWQSEEIIETANDLKEQTAKNLMRHTAYTTTLVTATADWSTRTLISSIMPIVRAEKVSYHTQYGYLVQAILRNWTANPLTPEQWENAKRVRLRAKSMYNGQQEEEFHGHWLIIDEFNRAPIDVALGEAMTALSTGEALQLLIAGKAVKLPLPKDFRIIGTLNSFDRHYLNQISEALKRRFTFVEILPPSRVHLQAEQAMVLYKALKDVTHISNKILYKERGVASWMGVVTVVSNSSGTYRISWNHQKHPLRIVFHSIVWPLFEVIRIYRQLGTAQAISLVRQILIRGLLEEYTEQRQWQAALDTALSNVIADQLQVLLPDELDVLLWHLKLEKEAFIQKYHMFISDLSMKRRRLAAHLEVLHRIVNDQGEPLLADEAIERLLDEEEEFSIIVPELLTPELLTEAFHLDHPPYKLPQFMRRLRTFKAEQGL